VGPLISTGGIHQVAIKLFCLMDVRMIKRSGSGLFPEEKQGVYKDIVFLLHLSQFLFSCKHLN